MPNLPIYNGEAYGEDGIFYTIVTDTNCNEKMVIPMAMIKYDTTVIKDPFELYTISGLYSASVTVPNLLKDIKSVFDVKKLGVYREDVTQHQIKNWALKSYFGTDITTYVYPLNKIGEDVKRGVPIENGVYYSPLISFDKVYIVAGMINNYSLNESIFTSEKSAKAELKKRLGVFVNNPPAKEIIDSSETHFSLRIPTVGTAIQMYVFEMPFIRSEFKKVTEHTLRTYMIGGVLNGGFCIPKMCGAEVMAYHRAFNLLAEGDEELKPIPFSEIIGRYVESLSPWEMWNDYIQPHMLVEGKSVITCEKEDSSSRLHIVKCDLKV